MKRIALIVALMLVAVSAHAQTAVRPADCVQVITPIVSVGTGAMFDNRGAGCVDWTLTYSTFGATFGVQIIDAPNINGQGTPVAFTGNVLGATFPVTAGSSGTISVSGYFPWMGVSVTSRSGASGSLQGTLYGWRSGPSASGVTVTSSATTGTLGATVFAVDTGPGALYGVTAYNGTAALCVIQVFDATAASVSLGTTVPVIQFPMPATGGTNFPVTPVALRNFTTAISVASTTAAYPGSTTCTTPTIATFFYR